MICKNRLQKYFFNKQPVLLVLSLFFLMKFVKCDIPISNELHCIDPGDIQHAIRRPDKSWTKNKVPLGTIFHFYCLNGYRMRGSGKMVCTLNGQWQPAKPPVCEIITCSYPNIAHARIETEYRNNFLPGTYLKVECIERYHFKEILLPQIVCQSDGRWIGSLSKSLPECVEEKHCPSPPSLLHGSYTTKDIPLPNGDYKNMANINYYCKDTYRLQNPDSFHWICNQGIWTGNKPKCVRNGCEEFSKVLNPNSEIVNRHVNTDLRPIYTVGTVLIVKCKSGFTLIGQKLFQCKENGYWEPSSYPFCVMNPTETGCDSPPTLDNGNYYDSRASGSGLFPIDSKISYRCFLGYYLEGTQQYVCRSNGLWFPNKPPMCIPIGDSSSTGISTRTISMITAGSILLVLLMVLVLVVVQRKQLNCHVCHTTQREMPITDDPDRVALIAFADGVQVVLPTYEEAIRHNGMPTFTGHSCVRVGRPPRGFHERRVLPNLPGSRSRIGSTHSNPSTESASLTRHASTSTSIGTHSSSVGSLETGTVSEVSTTVTLDTISSNTSNNSETVSCRAQCGSLASYDACIPSNEGAPLLEENEIQETSSNPDEEAITG